ncbi:hypothetical protein ACPPVO_54295 [Dactylosporangium sp. McL0621]|uniref:hypothetical protein n=1 Tax=Dactylosporangium sp. McL0621 TaxID=3415678 RepID=UPI003CF79AE7
MAGRSDVLVGVGTVLDINQLDQAVAAGAGFVVTPGFHAPVVERCLELGVPVLPGVATPGDVMAARTLGLDTSAYDASAYPQPGWAGSAPTRGDSGC